MEASMKKFLFLLSISTLTLHSFERIKDPLSYLPKFGIYDSQKYPLIPTYNAFLLPINVIIEAAPIELIKAILWGKGIKIKGKNPITLKSGFLFVALIEIAEIISFGLMLFIKSGLKVIGLLPLFFMPLAHKIAFINSIGAASIITL